MKVDFKATLFFPFFLSYKELLTDFQNAGLHSLACQERKGRKVSPPIEQKALGLRKPDIMKESAISSNKRVKYNCCY